MKTFCQWIVIAAWCAILHGGTTGSISGTITDGTQSVIPGVHLIATNIAQGIQFKASTDQKGAFALLPSMRHRVIG